MKFISESLRIIEYLKTQPQNTVFEIDISQFKVKHSDELALISDTINQMSNEGYFDYNCMTNEIKYDAKKIDEYEEFYSIRKELDSLYKFLIQLMRDATCILEFQEIQKKTYLTRPVLASCIYNFSSAVIIGINKILKDTGGKYNIESIATHVRSFIQKYQIQKDLDKSKNLKKSFSEYKKKVENDINKFNDFRDELFAHSDRDSILKVRDIKINKALAILKRCQKYTVDLINLIDDVKISNEEMLGINVVIGMEVKWFTEGLKNK